MVAEVDQYSVGIRTRILTGESKCRERASFAFGFFLSECLQAGRQAAIECDAFQNAVCYEFG